MSDEFKRMRVRVDRVVSTQIELSGKSRSAQRSGRSQLRKDRVEDDWDPGIANRKNGGRFKEVRVPEDNNMGYIKKNTPLNDLEEWRELEKKIEAYLEFNMRGSEEPSPNAPSYEPNQCKEENKATISKPPSKNEQESNPPLEDEESDVQSESLDASITPSVQVKKEEKQRRAKKKKRESDEESEKKGEIEKKDSRVEKPMIAIESKFERRQKNFSARASEVKRVFISANNLNSSLPISALSLLELNVKEKLTWNMDNKF